MQDSSQIEEEDPDFLLKIILIGDSGVGKTNLLSQFVRHQFSEENKTTIGVEFTTKTMNINGKVVKTQIWDTAGQERYRAITSAYYKGANGAMILYDITSSVSFDSVSRWLNELRDIADPKIILMLIGNKSDLEDSRSVSKEEGIKYAESQNLLFLETSAKSTANVEEAFNQLITTIVEMYTKNGLTGKEALSPPDPKPGVPVQTKEDKKCC
ncbi:ras-related protein RIC2-like [Histomonas meleagridis]|uniref:ras-related protein RIC2-like n=1 Tax=Histomonas meleagridis TaxID=135588 RepID=UPI00355A6C54|nr:ras-related protein RIC2-like [Histomonas meleagridis]KAH0805887.1 ras-related protein RIC2-like [Histomonas meleagridis]